MMSSLKELANRLKIKIKLAQLKAAKALAETIPEVIKIRTQQEGEGADGNKLKPLSKSYIEQRKGNLRFYTDKNGKKHSYIPKDKPNLSSDTSPETSNLTATGQLIDSIKGKNIGNKVIIEPGKSKRKGELYGQKSKLTNKQVNKYVDENGREFLKLSKAEEKEAFELAKDIITEEIRSVIK